MLHGDARAWGGTTDDRAFDLGEPRAEAVRCLAVVLVGLGWLLNTVGLLAKDSSVTGVSGFVIPVWLMVVAAASWVLLRRSVALGGTFLAGGLTGAIGTVVVGNPVGPVAGLFALVVIAAATVAGPRHGFAWATITSLIAGLVADRAGLAVSESTVVALALIWGSALVSWLGFRPVYTAAEWAWSSYHDALRLRSQELRVRQGELAQLSKSLNEACDRLEQQNVVLERARAAAEEARRLKAEFAAAISHELRTPVNLVVGLSELMMQTPEGLGERLSESHREDIEALYRNACHISQLIDDILDLSQVDAHRLGLQKEPLRLTEIVEQAVSVLATQFRLKGIYARIELPQHLPTIKADPTRLQQVLINLLGNAIRFTNHGGVTVSARLEEREVVVSVADTGLGIAPDEVPYVFEEFRQAGPERGRRGGSGLGLAVTKRLVELHGGNVRVESKVGQGSTLFFSLPLADEVAASPFSTDLEVLSRATVDGTRTLVVLGTDEHATRLIQRYLDDYRVVAAATGEQVHRLAQHGRVDALLVTSTEGTRRVEARRIAPPLPPGESRSTPVVYCPLRTRRTLAQEAGVAEYLVKPVVREQLQAALRRLRRRTQSVLVVEDDPEMRRMLVRMVRTGSRSRQIREAANGQEALQALRENRPDVVLLDLLMPEMDGYGFLEAVRAEERLRDLPVIVITAKGHESESVVAGELTITREGGFTIGEATRALRASLNVLFSPTPELTRSAGALPATPAA